MSQKHVPKQTANWNVLNDHKIQLNRTEVDSNGQ